MASPACPNCRSATSQRSWADLFGYECKSCSGLWIPGETLAQFLSMHSGAPRHGDLLDRANKGKPSPRRLQCPTCRKPSFRNLGAAGVELDMCGTCGGCYLDGEEVNAFLQSGRSRESAAAGLAGMSEVAAFVLGLFS